MEHFFLEDRFYHELGDLIDDLFPEDGAVEALEDDWSIRVQESKLEPMFQLTKSQFMDAIMDYTSTKYDDRFNEDSRIDDAIAFAAYTSFDLDKFNSLVPRLYYPTTFTMITKQDLLDYLND